MGRRLMAVAAEGHRGRVYISPTLAIEAIAQEAQPWWGPEQEINYHPRDIKTQIYGMTRYRDLFTSRQLVALTTFVDLDQEARERVRQDALATGQPDKKPLYDGGTGDTAYGEAVGTYMAFALSKALTRNCTQTVWYTDRDSTMAGFSRQAIPMTWDYAEVNPLLEATGSIAATASWVAEVLEGSLATG